MSFYENNENSNNLKRFKIVLLGDQAVGKSSIINRYVSESFTQTLESTVGVDFQVKTISLKGVGYKLHLWDTAG